MSQGNLIILQSVFSGLDYDLVAAVVATKSFGKNYTQIQADL